MPKDPNYAFHVLTAGRIEHSKIQCHFRNNLLGQLSHSNILKIFMN